MKHLKRTMALLLAVVMVLSCTVIAGAAEADCPSAGFTDVPAEGNWAHAGIDFMLASGYMKGTGATTFGPKDSTSRAMIVTILYRMAGSPAVTGTVPFGDVKTGTWYHDAILWGIQNGVTSGLNATTFAPNQKVTREQIAAFLYRNAGQPAVTGEDLVAAAPDGSKVGSYARTAVHWALCVGVLTGKQEGGKSYIAPKDKASRAEVAAMIYRYANLNTPAPVPPVTVTVGDKTEGYDTLDAALAAAGEGATVTVAEPVTLAKDAEVKHSISIKGADKITFTGKLALAPEVVLAADASLADAILAPEGYTVKETGSYNYILVANEQPAPTAMWLSTWGTAEEKCENSDHRPKSSLPGTTVRQMIKVTTTGSKLRLKLSNQYGSTPVNVESLHIAKQVKADQSTIDTSTDTVVTVGGSESFQIPAGKTLVTDEVEFEVNALENIAISMYFGSVPSTITGHRGARATTYQISGNQVSTETLTSAQTTTSWYFLSEVSMYMPEGGRAVVCFGDSITDGYGTDASYLNKKPDSYTRWGDYFAKRLQADEKTKNVSVINEGIGANGMLDSYPTDAGKDRYARDLLDHDGVAYVIIHFGVNDMNNLSNTSKYDRMIAEYRKMIDLAHENDILVYVAPILPFKGNSYYSAASEQLRTMINDWFRAQEDIDGIIDFESAVVDPSDPLKIQEKYTHDDGLHPYDGYSAMADAIDLSLFYTGWSACEHSYVATVTAPTCNEGGYTTNVCAKCGKTRTTDKTAALGHAWDEGEITRLPTATERGERTFTCTRCGEKKVKSIPRLNETNASIDFTDPAAAEDFQIVNPSASAIREGQGLYMVTTRPAFEPCNGQNSGDQATNPQDLVLVPVSGDSWIATLKFDFSQGSASNGYYQFFGFYAMAADGDAADYNNCAGIRCGNNNLQNFLRENGTITAETDGVMASPGLASAGTYWLRIVREGNTYTCFRSSDGESFTEMFSYTTDIEAEYLAIDAYTGMTTGYEFYLKSLIFE